jgi:gamma-glutamyltranspeptidase/glutathione hydrolase
VAPPAVVPGLLEAHARFGRRPRADVLAPAVRLARDGFPVGPYLAWALEQHLAQGGAGRGGEFDSLFYPGGKPLRRGSLLVQRDLAGTLETISELGADAVRSGPVAAAICEAAVADGGVLTPDDLAQDRVVVGPPATTTFADSTLYGPSRDVSGAGVLFPALDEISPEALGKNRSPDYVAALADGLRRAWSMRLAEAGIPAGHPHTTHLAAAGPDDDLATLTFTHGPWFGSDLIAPGTGIVLNAGANVLAPISGGRAATNMCPIVLDAPGGARHALGAAGGPRIPALLLTTVVDVVHYEMPLEQAIAAPHLAVRAADGTLEVEAELRVDGRAIEGAATMSRFDFGPVCGITRVDGDCFAAPDRRFENGLARAGSGS